MYVNADSRVRAKNTTRCTAGYEYYTISCNGTVTRCWSQINPEVLGSVRDLWLTVPRSSVCESFTCTPNCEQTKVVFERDGVRHVGRYVYADADYNLSAPPHRRLMISAAIEPTCNYNCPYCTASCERVVQRSSLTDLTTEEWVRWWSWLGQQSFQGVSVQLTGGEPTLHPGFAEIARQVACLAGKHEFFSNLSLCSPLKPFTSGEIKDWFIYASAHLWNQRFDIDVFLERALKLQLYHTVHVVIVKVKENMPYVDAAYKRIVGTGLPCFFSIDEKDHRERLKVLCDASRVR